jgi:8-oxo-dGTP pyrophosphatase MutT (NUDIX family)
VSMPAWALRLAEVVPTVEADALSRFTPPPGRRHREAAVLILFGPGTDRRGEVVLLERAADMRSHPGQVAFPGGAAEPGEDAEQAALREAHEEVGLDPSTVRVLGALPVLFLPPSGFAVTPVVGWWERPHELQVRDPVEVARVERVPLPELLDPANRFTTVLSGGLRGPAFAASGLFVWGFTGGLLARLLHAAGIGDPWDQTRVRPVPTAQLRDRRPQVLP